MPYTPAHVLREITFPGVIQSGAKGMNVRRVQEWLTYHDHGTAIDSDFGDGTKRAVESFQKDFGLTVTGRVDQKTWDELVAPMVKAVSATVPGGDSFDVAVYKLARVHLKLHPREAGEDNEGAWVRAYMEGNQGKDWKWCAGFVTFLMKQAKSILGGGMPIEGSFSCDLLASQAKAADRFVPGKDIASGKVKWADLGKCWIFLVRKTSADWTHTGLAMDASGSAFGTIEANTNDEGSSNGYEVCARSRALDGKDFIKIT
jgi:hypothetical protein